MKRLRQAEPSDLRDIALRPMQLGYQEVLCTNNRTLTHEPSLIVPARDATDVASAIKLARTQRQSVAVQATGHGMSVASDGVLVTTARLARVEIDVAARRACIGAGSRWGDVLAATVPHGLAPLHGSSPTVGAAGFTLGGGVGPLGRSHGYGADHVHRLEMVTADAAIRTLTPTTDPDLFWAVRGSKGNLGIVTELELELFPVGDFLGGGLYFDGSRATEIVNAYSSWAIDNLHETATSLLLATFPDVDDVPDPLRGRFVAHLRFAHFGDLSHGASRIESMRLAAPILLDTVQRMPYRDIARVHHDPDAPYEVFESGFFTGPLGDAEAAALMDAARQHGMLAELRHHGGAYAQRPSVGNPVCGRDAEFTVYLGCAPTRGSAARDAHDQVRRAFSAVDRGTVLNFLGVGADPRWVRDAFSPDDLQRLVEIKRAVDPEDLFRVNHNLPTEGTAS